MVFRKLLLWFVGVILLLLLVIIIGIQLPVTQRFITRTATHYLEEKLQTRVYIGEINLGFPKDFVIKEVYLEDQSQDTLIGFNQLAVRVGLSNLIRREIAVDNIYLDGLQANVYQNSEDETSNYDFIVDAFSQEEAAESSKEETTWEVNLGSVTIENTNLRFQDMHNRLKLTTSLDALYLDMSGFDIDDMSWSDGQINLSNFGFGMTTPQDQLEVVLTQLSIDVSDVTIDSTSVDLEAIQLANSEINYSILAQSPTKAPGDSVVSISNLNIPWDVMVHTLLVENVAVSYHDQTQLDTVLGFDANHMVIDSFSTTMEDIEVQRESAALNIASMTFIEKSGLSIEGLSTQIKLSNTQAEVSDFRLKTKHSELQTAISLSYPQLNDLVNNPDHIRLALGLHQTYVGLQDIMLFLPELDSLTRYDPLIRKLRFSSNITGSAAHLNLGHFTINHGTDDIIKLSGSAYHLLDPDSVNSDIDLRVNNSAFTLIKEWLPELSGPVQLPEHIALMAKLKSDYQAIAIDTDLVSNRGQVFTKVQYKMGQIPSYYIETDIKELDLWYLLGQDKLGKLSTQIVVDGTGTSTETLAASLDFKIDSLYWMGYQYKSIRGDAIYGGQQGNFILSSDDPNLHFDLETTLDQSGWVTRTAIEVHQIKLDQLNYTKSEISTAGRFTINTQGNSLDSLTFRFDSEEAQIIKGNEIFDLNTSSAELGTYEQSAYFNLDFPFIQSYFNANFSIDEIHHVIQSMPLLDAVLAQTDAITRSDYKMELGISSVNQPLIKDLFLEDLDTLQFNKFIASYDQNIGTLNMTVDIPKMSYGPYQLDSLWIDAKINDEVKHASVSLSELRYNDITSHKLRLSSEINEAQKISLLTQFIDDKNEIPLSIGLTLGMQDSLYQISLAQDSLIIGYEPWQVDPKNQLLLSKQGISLAYFDFEHGEASLNINGYSTPDSTTINLLIDQLPIHPFAYLLAGEAVDFGGYLGGKVEYIKSNSAKNLATVLDLNQFYYQEDTLGDLHLEAGSQDMDLFAFDAGLRGLNNQFGGEGTYHVSQDVLDAKLAFEKIDLSTFEPLAGGQLQNLKGNLTGSVRVLGKRSQPSLSGSLNFTNTSFNTRYLSTYFSLDDETIAFDREEVQFDDFVIKDASSNTAKINGLVSLSEANGYKFDLQLVTDQFLLLDTEESEEELFYGKLLISSKLGLKGDINNPKVTAYVKVIKGSNMRIIVPESEVKTVEHEGVVSFISADQKRNQKDSVDTMQSGLTGVVLLAKVETDPTAKITILMDRNSGDYLEVQGQSYLNYNITPNGLSSLTGTYEVNQGMYQLSFYSLIKKQFSIGSGSKIIWTGDPYNAKLDAQANYTVKTAPLPLVKSQIDESSISVYREVLPFVLGLNVGGEILSPEISFSINLTEENENFQGGIVTSKLNLINKEESELNKQVFSLLLFNSFMSEDSYSGRNGVNNTARNSVSQLLSDQLNRLSNKYIKSVQVDFGVDSYTKYSSGPASGNTDLTLQLSKQLFNERLVVTVGSNLTLEGEDKDNSLNNFAQDIVLQYKLDPDGIFRLSAFRKNQYEGVIDGELTKTGVGLSINKSYNNWQDFVDQLYNKKEKKTGE